MTVTITVDSSRPDINANVKDADMNRLEEVEGGTRIISGARISFAPSAFASVAILRKRHILCKKFTQPLSFNY